MFIITAGVAEDVCILSIWPCEFNKEMQTSLDFQVRGIINTNQQKTSSKITQAYQLAGMAPGVTLKQIAEGKAGKVIFLDLLAISLLLH